MLHAIGHVSGLRGLLKTQIPYLRRFGAVVSNCQRQADLTVLLLMNELLHSFEFDEVADAPRAVLYKRFLEILPFAFGGRELPLPTPVSRQADLLISVEGFSHDETARILGVPVAQIPALLEAAYRDRAEGRRARILIIENEPRIAMELKRYSRELGHVVSGTAATRKRAMQIAQRDKLDLILSDERLGDGSSGVDVVRTIRGEKDLPVIFITGFPEVILSRQHEEPLFLIAKPCTADAVKAMISQALFLRSIARQPDIWCSIAKSLKAGPSPS